MATPIRSFADRETDGMVYTRDVKHSPIANIFDGRRYKSTTNEIDLPSTSLKGRMFFGSKSKLEK